MDQEQSGMDHERSGGISSTGVVLIVLACVGLAVVICGGVIVVCLVAITALGTSANRTFGTVGTPVAAGKTFGTVGGAVGGITSPPLAARQFVNDLGAGLTQAAWDQTGAGFQLRHSKVGSPDQSKYFTDFLQENPGIRDPASIEIKQQMADANQATVQATITSKTGGKTILSLILKMESGSWKVDDVAVLDANKKKDGEKEKQTPPKDAAKN
jgi:hypothetical protein